MSWTLCTSGSAIVKAGVNANSTITASGSTLAAWSDEAEADVCTLARYDVIANYATLTTDGKKVVGKYCSAYIAQNIINYDPDAIGRSTATFMLNILENQKGEFKQLVKDDKFKTYLNISS